MAQFTINGLRVHESVTLERICEAVESYRVTLDNPGICILCGVDVDGVEPDAEKYDCENCTFPAVYGAEQLLIYLAPIE
jgi:hypothetical protein